MSKENNPWLPKVSILLNIALMGLVGFLLYTKKEMTVKPLPEKEEVPGTICKDYSLEPMDGITFQTAQDMFANYDEQYKRIGILPNDSVDAQSVWFDLETLKKYFYKIEDTLIKQNVAVPDLKLGIRIYYAAYPKKETMAKDPALSGLPENYEYHHTVFMVPTFTDATDTTIKHDFNPWYPDLDGANSPTSIPDIVQQKDQNPALTSGFILSIGSSLYIKNHGQVGPPPAAAVPGTSYFRILGQPNQSGQ